MRPLEESSGPAPISRREVIRRTALLLGATVSSSLVACVDRGRSAGAGVVTAPAHLTAARYAVTGAIAERIMPATDTPGALDVGVPAFIDLAYGEFMTGDEQRMFVDGLDAVETGSVAAYGASFVALAPIQQDELLRSITAASQDEDRSFFRQIREATVLGYFTSEEVGRNVTHYDPVPGRFDPCLPVDEVGNVVWTS